MRPAVGDRPVLDLAHDLVAVDLADRDHARAACSPSVTVHSLTAVPSSATSRCRSKAQLPAAG